MWRENEVYSVNGYPGCRTHEKKRHDNARDRLGFTMAIGVFRIGRLAGNSQADPQQDRAQHIGTRLRCISNKRIGVAYVTRNGFYENQDNTDYDANLRSPKALY